MFGKIVRSNQKKRLIFFATLCILAVCGVYLMTSGGETLPTQGAAEDNAGPVRLHIIANSDDPKDQLLKLAVRDKVVETLTPLLEKATTKAEAETIVKDNIPLLESVAAATVADAGYGAKGMFGRYEFPDRTYGQLFLAAGDYDALRIILGKGEGKNWWCVLFPPLCFMDGASTVSTQVVPAMSNNGRSEQIKIRFKILGSLDEDK